jgi:hypothetical protein
MHALGIVEGDQPLTPDTMAYWSSYFQRETITGPVAGSTPIVTSQSPPPPSYPVYPSPSYSQPPPIPMAITMAALAIGGLLLFFLVRGIRA